MTHLKKTLGAATAAFLALSLPATAGQLRYDCDMKGSKRNGGWTSPKIIFVLPGDGTVQVVDALTLHFLGKPLEGKLLRDSKTHMHVKWTIKDARADNNAAFANVDYKAVVAKSSGRITLNAKPRHYDIGLTDDGRCTARTK